MKILVKIIYIFFSSVFIFYLLLPNPEFPKAPPDALQSGEPADTETPLRQAYFTNFSRKEVMHYFQSQMQKNHFLGMPLPAYSLNYPPEEAKTIIRDQTRSTFLEEIVHPFRESLFVNGFEAKDEKDTIFIGGQVWKQKITVRFVPSNVLARILVGLSTLILVTLVYKSYLSTTTGLREEILKRWTSR